MTITTVRYGEFVDSPLQSKPWGHEIVFATGENDYVGKLITVRAGEALSLQYHDDKDETISVLTGEVQLVEVSTAAPGWREDVVRLTDRYGRAGTSTP